MQDKVRAPAKPEKDGNAEAALLTSRARVQRILELAAMPDAEEGAQPDAPEAETAIHPLYRQAMFD